MSQLLAPAERPALPRQVRALRPHRARGRFGYPLLLAAWCGLLFFYGLGSGELYRTESLRALVAAECLRSGDWLVPTLYGEPLLSKPPGMYIAIALASWPAGRVTTVTARLPSACAATVVVFLVYWTFARTLGRRAGFIAALVTPASLLWLDRVPSAEIDMIQVAWVAAALCFFFRAIEEEDRYRWWLAALLCVAGGFLTKWTAPAFFYLTAVPLLCWRRQLRLLWSPPHLLAASLAILVVLGWIGAVVLRVGLDPLVDAVRREALPRLSPLAHTRPYSWRDTLAQALLFLAAALPWSACAFLSMRRGFAGLWSERGRCLLKALHCWTWPNLLFWSVIPGHHIRHSVPLLTGLTGLAALVWIAWLDGRLSWPWPRWPARRVFVVILILFVMMKVLFVEWIVFRRDDCREPQSKGKLLARHVPEGTILYLSRLKDEGILFYYGRPARRISDLTELGSDGQTVYCVLTQAEWRDWPSVRPADLLVTLHDEQGEPICLIKTRR